MHENPSAITHPLMNSSDFWSTEEHVINSGSELNPALQSEGAQSLWPIHEFVRKVLITSRLGFDFRSSRDERIRIDLLPLGRRYWDVNSYLMRIPQYAAPYGYIGLFLHCCRKLRLDIDPLPPRPEMPQQNGFIGADIFNRLIALIRAEAYLEPHVRATESLQRCCQETFSDLKHYTDEMLSPGRYSKLLVVRVDLSYRKEFSHEISWSEVLQDFKRFLANRRWNRIFDHCVGYIRKLEYTAVKGPHFHLILFFNGQYRRGDIYIAMQVCEYWRTVITRGKGLGFNCNLKHESYKHDGIGMIARNDHLKRANFLYALSYLCKHEQQLPVDAPSGTRVITRGELPPCRLL